MMIILDHPTAYSEFLSVKPLVFRDSRPDAAFDYWEVVFSVTNHAILKLRV
jgi:hypothetical protein